MKRAILIASSDFSSDSGIEPLRFATHDVDAMENILQSDDFGFDVEKLINVPHNVAMQSLSRWTRKANYDDLLVIYFSGHGKLSLRRELCLSCADTTNEDVFGTTLRYTYLTDLIRERSLQKVVVILDCCYAGRAIEGMRSDVRSAVEEQVNAAVVQSGGGIFFLGASGKNQTAQEREIEGHGRLTKQIIDGLSSGDADIDGDGNISAKDLATFVKRRLRDENAEQEPIEGGAYRGELILGGNRRKQLHISLKTIRTELESVRSHLRKETYRQIDDYLDDIKSHADVAAVVSDPRYVALNRYATQRASLQEVFESFWDPSKFGGKKDERPPPLKEDGASSRDEAKPQSLLNQVALNSNAELGIRMTPMWLLSATGAFSGFLIYLALLAFAKSMHWFWGPGDDAQNISGLVYSPIMGGLAAPLHRKRGPLVTAGVLLVGTLIIRLIVDFQHFGGPGVFIGALTAGGIALVIASVDKLLSRRRGAGSTTSS
jgi:Caspase domain